MYIQYSILYDAEFGAEDEASLLLNFRSPQILLYSSATVPSLPTRVPQ